MFTLITDRSRYFKVKRGQSAREIERELKTPVHGKAFSGRIIKVYQAPLREISADVGDTYATVAAKYGCNEALLKEINASAPVYPTCKIFVPEK